MAYKIKIKLTDPQADQVRWALGPMKDYAKDPASEFMPGDVPSCREIKNELAIVDGDNAIAVLEDLLYRLEIQLPAMSKGQCWQDVQGDIRAARNVANKIREAVPETLDAH